MDKLFKLQLIISLLSFLFFAPASADSSLQINNIVIHEAPPTVKVLAGYLDIKNDSQQPISLISVKSPLFAKVEFHGTLIEDGVAKMVHEKEISIPAGSVFSFSPGQYHLMLFNPTQPLKSGDSVPLEFHFSDNTEIMVNAIVIKADSHEHHH